MGDDVVINDPTSMENNSTTVQEMLDPPMAQQGQVDKMRSDRPTNISNDADGQPLTFEHILHTQPLGTGNGLDPQYSDAVGADNQTSGVGDILDDQPSDTDNIFNSRHPDAVGPNDRPSDADNGFNPRHSDDDNRFDPRYQDSVDPNDQPSDAVNGFNPQQSDAFDFNEQPPDSTDLDNQQASNVETSDDESSVNQGNLTKVTELRQLIDEAKAFVGTQKRRARTRSGATTKFSTKSRHPSDQTTSSTPTSFSSWVDPDPFKPLSILQDRRPQLVTWGNTTFVTPPTRLS